MKRLSLLAIGAALALGGAAAPALAAPGAVPFCASGSDSAHLDRRADMLAGELQLSSKLASSIEVWNGCFKVMTTSAGGATTNAFYDPDSLRLVAQMG